MEKPFSFQAADEQRAAIKEAVAALAKNPNRFQVRTPAILFPVLFYMHLKKIVDFPLSEMLGRW
jgi:hypothetical protein